VAFRPGDGAVGAAVRVDAGPAAIIPASAGADAVVGHAGTEPVGRRWCGVDGGPQERWRAAGIADPAALYPGIDSRDRGEGCGIAGHAGDRLCIVARLSGDAGAESGPHRHCRRIAYWSE